MVMVRTLLKNISQGLEKRFKLQAILDRLLNDPVPERAGWWYTLGAAIFILLVLQVFTGIFLLFEYVPSFEQARESVTYIQKQAPWGWAIRGFHYWNMVILVLLVGAHMLRTFISAAFKAPREITWVLGVLLLLLMVATAYTGLILRWDQAAYFDLAVGLRIAEYVPFVGPWIATLWRGGESINPFTLQRTFTFHVYLLPLALLLIAVVHIGLVILLGQYGSWINYKPEETPLPESDDQQKSRQKLENEILSAKRFKVNLPTRTTFFFPHHVYKEAIVSFLFFAINVGLILLFPVPIDKKVDPATITYSPSSIWFFLFFDQALELFPGTLMVSASAIVPLLVMGTLFLWPWLEAGPQVHPAKRVRPLVFMFAIIFSILAFALLGASRVYNFQFINQP